MPTARAAIRIAVLGDRVPGYSKHTSVVPALERAARAAGVGIAANWIPSMRLAGHGQTLLEAYDGALAAPQSHEYTRDPDALVEALRLVRQSGVPCLATCGGAQFALVEHARRDGAKEPFVGPILERVSCNRGPPGAGGGGGRTSGTRSAAVTPISGPRPVHLVPETRSARAYGRVRVEEPFACSFVLSPAAEAALRTGGVTVAGTTPAVGATLFEWRDHPFYVAALFLPQWGDQPHPLFESLVRVARARPDRPGARGGTGVRGRRPSQP